MAAELNLKRKHWKRSSRRLHEMILTRETMWTGQKRNVKKQSINWRWAHSTVCLHSVFGPFALLCLSFTFLLSVLFAHSRPRKFNGIFACYLCLLPYIGGTHMRFARTRWWTVHADKVLLCFSFFVRSLLWSVAAGWIMVFRLELSGFFHSLLLVYF